MTHWKRKVKLGDVFEQYRNQEITSQDLSKVVVERLKKLNINDDNFQNIVVCFEELSEDTTSDIDDFDNVLDTLYDWADDGHKLWVDTF